jgi:hypothetical protein
MDSFSLRELFVPMSGLIVAVVATVGAILTAILGPSKKLRLPMESVPGTSRGLLNVVLFAPFLICFFLMEPAWARPALFGALVPMVGAVWCYQNYGGVLNTNRYIKPRARRFLWFQWVREEPLIGGSELKPEAAARKARTGRTEQEILADAEYDPDEIWNRESRALVQKKIERWYYGFMLCALLTVVLAALAAQTLLSGEAPLAAAQRVWTKLTAPSM